MSNVILIRFLIVLFDRAGLTGSYVVKANLYNNNQNLLVCINIAFTLQN